MTIDVSRLREQLPELLDHAVETGDVCHVERNGEPYAVIVSAREWRRQTIGKRLDAAGARRLSKERQRRTEALLAASHTRKLTRAERRELNTLLKESEAVMLRRAEALKRV